MKDVGHYLLYIKSLLERCGQCSEVFLGECLEVAHQPICGKLNSFLLSVMWNASQINTFPLHWRKTIKPRQSCWFLLALSSAKGYSSYPCQSRWGKALLLSETGIIFKGLIMSCAHIFASLGSLYPWNVNPNPQWINRVHMDLKYFCGIVFSWFLKGKENIARNKLTGVV